MTGTRADPLARLDVFTGDGVVEAGLPGRQPAPSRAAGASPRARALTYRGTG